jgi:hypothetical protein
MRPFRPTFVAALVLAALVAGCASTRLTTQWSDPALAQAKFSKVLVAFQSREEPIRRALEDTMARSIPNATPSYQVLDEGDLLDVKRSAAKLKAAGFDSAVVMRLVSMEKELTFFPPAPAPYYPYGRMWGGWTRGWGYAYDSGYMRTDKIATVGTLAYTLADEKLVWASQSETFNPGDPVKMIEEVVQANAEAARKAIGK